jgi:hypothetical protein
MPAQRFFIFSQPTLLLNQPAVMAARQSLYALQHMRARAGFKSGHDHVRKIALNPYKQAISLQSCPIKNLLVQCGIGAI